MHYYQEEI